MPPLWAIVSSVYNKGAGPMWSLGFWTLLRFPTLVLHVHPSVWYTHTSLWLVPQSTFSMWGFWGLTHTKSRELALELLWNSYQQFKETFPYCSLTSPAYLLSVPFKAQVPASPCRLLQPWITPSSQLHFSSCNVDMHILGAQNRVFHLMTSIYWVPIIW
jgi:hypothetical protein